MKIFVLEDDPDQAALIELWLQEAQHDCHVFDSGRTFIREIPHDVPDLVILDWNVPGLSGLEVMQWLKSSEFQKIPILFATTRATEQDVVQALEEGADDYLIKPLRGEELKARITAISRRNRKHPQKMDTSPYEFEDSSLKISFGSRQNEVKLTIKEYQLAKYFFRYPNRIVSRDKLLESIWTKSASVSTRTVDTHVSRLRKKLQLDGSLGWKLISVYHQGYKLIQIDNTEVEDKQVNE